MKLVLSILLIGVCCVSNAQEKIGYWSSDKAALPVYNYTGAIPFELDDKEAAKAYPADPWFLLGNYSLTSFIHTSGKVSLYTLQRAWGVVNNPGLGQLPNKAEIMVGKKSFVLTDVNSAYAQGATKKFGTGYASFGYSLPGLKCMRTVSVPPSEKINEGVSALLVTIEFENVSGAQQKFTYAETFAANYRQIGGADTSLLKYETSFKSIEPFTVAAVYKAKTPDPTLIPEKSLPANYDGYPPALFVSSLVNDGQAKGENNKDGASLAIQYTIALKKGERKSIQYFVGYSFDDAATDIKRFRDVFKEAGADYTFRDDWKKIIPSFDQAKDTVFQRELKWNCYTLEATAKYNRYFEETFIPQGMHYDYQWGNSAATRDHIHYGLPTVYTNPRLAKSIIRYVAKAMQPTGALAYGLHGFGMSTPSSWCPSDFQLTYFWLVSEYLNHTNDFEILRENVPYYPKANSNSSDVLDKLERAFIYLRDEVNVGLHGMTKMLNADWNDQVWADQPINSYYWSAESHYNVSLALVALDRLQTSLKTAMTKLDDQALRARIATLSKSISIYRDKQLKAFMKDMEGRTFARRAWYNLELGVGEDKMHLESQVFSLLVPELSKERRQLMLNEIESRLLKGEVLGARLSETDNESKLFKQGTRENAGIWYFMQGNLSIGALSVDKEKAYKLIRMAGYDNFSKHYPNYWVGQWSSLDALNSSLAKYPGMPDNPDAALWFEFPVYCTHIHSWPVYFYYRQQKEN